MAKRLTRMTTATLREMLKDDNREIRRAAAVACALKNDKLLIPDLIEKLNDSENTVIGAVHSSLVALSSQDFGPKADAMPSEKAEAIAAWKSWWKGQMK